ncbi:MAG: rhodanese-like domain-containing protein [Brevefilum sp.]|nr:rhodanese-like domain-containing protein [Brevefilum sp.]MDW7755652.1 rhodanese-like domain-containing protein [Brevefilum sp.]
MKKLNLAAFLLFVIVLTSCASKPPVEESGDPYEDISAETLAGMMKERRDSFLLINTHIPYEGDIPDTDLSIPYNEITAYLDQLPADKDAEIVLYCRSDNMSRTASEDLAALGYTNLKNLDGGFIAWRDAGYPFETAP